MPYRCQVSPLRSVLPRQGAVALFCLASVGAEFARVANSARVTDSARFVLSSPSDQPVGMRSARSGAFCAEAPGCGRPGSAAGARGR
jgi:hypothetical protein